MSSTAKLILLLISVSILVAVTRTRLPLNRGAVKAAQVWQVIYEKERMDSGLLANAVAPKDRPVLWTGHGYPAYMFHGYVVDYAGLNFRKIWAAVDEARSPSPGSVAFLKEMGLNDQEIHNPAAVEYKSGLLLMKNHEPNVYMQHSLFPPAIQKARHMRLMGSFYTIDLVGAPAFRVFVEDKQWHQITLPLPDTDIKTDTPSADTHQLGRQGKAFLIHAPNDATELLFGVEQGNAPVVVSINTSNGLMQSCTVPPIQNTYRLPEVHACQISLQPSANQATIRISSQQSIKIYEPAFTVAFK